MKYIIAALLTLGLLACVSPQDLEALAFEQREAQVALKGAQDDFQEKVEDILSNQTLSQEQKQVALEDARGVRDQKVSDALDQFGEASQAIAQAVEDRTRNAIQAPVPISGNPLIDLLLSLGATVGTAVYGTNMVRDRRRSQRGEPVGKPS